MTLLMRQNIRNGVGRKYVDKAIRKQAITAIPTKKYPATKSPTDGSIGHSPSVSRRRERKKKFSLEVRKKSIKQGQILKKKKKKCNPTQVVQTQKSCTLMPRINLPMAFF
jgi:hypothetical protein